MKKLLLLLFALLALGTGGAKAEATAYAVWCADNTTLYFLGSETTLSAGSTFTPEGAADPVTITTVWSGTAVTASSTSNVPGWQSTVRSSVTTAVFEPSFHDFTPTSLRGWFYQCSKLTSVQGISNLNTSATTNMAYMFSGCSILESIDLSHFNTSAVTNASQMFYGCNNLESLNLSGWTNTKLTNASQMFQGCSALTTLNLTNFGTAAVQNMSSMFKNCTSLTSLDLSGFDTGNVTTTQEMFNYCNNLESLNLSGWTNTKLTNASQMFQGCSALTTLNLTNFGTAAVQNMSSMFKNCTSLTSLDLSGFNTASTTNMSYMFQNCETLGSLDLSSFNTASTTNMSYMFDGCKELSNVNLSSFNTAVVVNGMGYMFRNCQTLTSLDLSSFNTAKVTNMAEMFNGCTNLVNIYVSLAWTTGLATNSTNMFKDCTSLVGQDGTTLATYNNSSLDRTHATDEAGGYLKTGTTTDLDEPLAYAIWCADNATLYFLQSNKQLVTGRSFTPAGSETPVRMTTVWSGTQVTTSGTSNPQWYNTVKTALQHVVFEPSFADVAPAYTYAWFRDCVNLTDLTGISYLNTANATNMAYMFQNCTSLQSLNLTGFNTEKVINMSYMFQNCSSLQSLDVTMFNTAKVQSMQYTFNGCSSLTSLDLSSFTMEAISSLDYMFKGCTGLTTLNLSSFNIGSRSPSIKEMFNGCSQLESIYVSYLWTLAKRTDADVFTGCTALTGEDGTAYDASAVTAAKAHYGVGGYLRKGTQTPDNETATNYAVYCADNTTIYFIYSKQPLLQGGVFVPEGETIGHVVTVLKSNNSGNVTSNPSWDNTVKQNATTAVFESSYSQLTPTSLYNCFYGCTALNTVNGLSNLNTENVTDMRNVFYNCSTLQTLDLSPFVTTKVTNMSSMFYGCSSLSSILVGDGWTTASVSSSSNMFYGCTHLPNFDSSVIDKTNAHPYEGGYLGEGTSTPVAPTVYAVWSADNATLYFLKSTKRLVAGRRFTPAGSETAVTTTNVWSGDKIIATGNNQPIWISTSTVKTAIQHVVFEASFADVVPASVYRWFEGCTVLTDITGMEYLNTSEATRMYQMFYNCKLLTSLDLSHFNTANVVTMRNMFYNCTALETLDLSSFTTPEVTDISCMFYNCSALQSLDLHGFSNEKLTIMDDIFTGCTSLATLNMNGFGIGNVTYLYNLFNGCSSLQSLDLHTLNTANVTRMYYMFKDCSSLKSVNLSGWNTEKVTTISAMFLGCTSLQSVDLSSFRCTALTDMSALFSGCESLQTIDLSSLGQTNVGSINGMFNGCKNVRTINLSGFGTGNVTSLSSLFRGMENLESVDLSGITMSGVTSMENMFDGCKKLQSISLTGTTGEVTNVTAMFRDCEALTTLDISGLRISDALRNYNYMFKNCRSLTSIDLTSLATGVPWYLIEMFSGCESLQAIDFSPISFSFVKDMTKMLSGCSSLTSVDLSQVSGNGLNVENLTSLFEGCSSLESVNMNMSQLCDQAWRNVWNNNSTKYVQVTNLFKDCTSLVTIDLSGLYYATAGSNDLTGLFSGCTSLQNLNLNKISMSKAANISSMFEGCTSLTELDLSTFYTETVTNMSSMFKGCTQLESIYIDDSWTTEAVTESTDMFAGCTALVGQNGSRVGDVAAVDVTRAHANTGGLMRVVAIPYAIYCGDIHTLFITNRNALYAVGDQFTPEGRTESYTITTLQMQSDVTGSSTFLANEANAANSVFIEESFASVRPTGTGNWFKGGSELMHIFGIENLNTSEVYNMSSMFEGCSNLTTLNLSTFDMSNVGSVSSMFSGCVALKTVNLNFAQPCTDQLVSLSSLFYNCRALESVDMTGFNTTNVEYMNLVFTNCQKLQSINFGENWTTANVEDMSFMFGGCNSLTSIDLSHFSVENCTDMSYMFAYCSTLTELDMSDINFEVQKDYASVRYIFYGCSNLQTIYVSDEWIDHYSDYVDGVGYTLFTGCTSIVGGSGTTYDSNNVSSAMANADTGYFTYKGIDVTIPSSGIGTFSAPYNTIVPEGLTAWIAPDYEGDESIMILQQLPDADYSPAPEYYNTIRTVAPANSGLLLRGTPGETVKLVRTHKASAVVDESYFEHNMLVPVVEPTHIEPIDGDYTNFMLKSGVFVRIADNSSKMPANKAYLQLPTADLNYTGSEARSIALSWGDSTATSGTSVGLSTQQPDEYYDLQGRRVKHPAKGIYIHNGKKTSVK